VKAREHKQGTAVKSEVKGTMMNKLWPLLLPVIPFRSIHAQAVHHAPTVEQCRVDLKLRLSRLESEQERKTVSYNELTLWGFQNTRLPGH